MWHKHRTFSVGFSRVAELYPKLCILAGAKATHTTCVFVIHQNIILMVQGAHLRAHFNAKRKSRKNVVLSISETCALSLYKLHRD
jgi:hypothetical protein